MPLYYRPKTFSNRLEEEGIKYSYMKGLGNPSKLRKKALEEAKIVSFGKEVSVFNFQNAKRIKRGENPKRLKQVDLREWQRDIQRFKKEKDKKVFWRGNLTKAFKEWMKWECIDQRKMDKLAKQYYLDYISKKEREIIKLIKLIEKYENLTFCLTCSCNTQDINKCHRFWLREKIYEYLCR
jgi:uncharacterized protein YeaO (DUF488 family)